MTVNMIVCAVLTALGLLFMIASLVGIAKLPDFFTRLHAQGVGDTIGAFLILAGMAAAAWGGLLPVKILLIFIVIVLTNPIGTNLMMIAAINKEDYLGYRTKMSGEKKAVSDPEPNVTSEPENMAVSEPENVAASEPDNISVAESSAPADRPENQDKAETDTPEPEKPAKSARRRRSKSKSADTDASKDRTEDNSKDKTKDKSRSNTRKKTKNKPEDKGSSKNNRRRKPKPSMKMNKAELIKEAESRGIKVSDKATKREILDHIYSKTTD